MQAPPLLAEILSNFVISQYWKVSFLVFSPICHEQTDWHPDYQVRITSETWTATERRHLATNLVTGNLHSLLVPCSIPVPIRLKNTDFPAKYSPVGTYLVKVVNTGAISPVFSRVSREFGGEQFARDSILRHFPLSPIYRIGHFESPHLPHDLMQSETYAASQFQALATAHGIPTRETWQVARLIKLRDPRG
jgi:hypothetical protein